MKYLEKIFFFLFPHLLLSGTQWAALWDEQEKKQFLNAMRVFFPIAICVYVLHYFTVDRSEGLAPSDLWFNYRFGMAGIGALSLMYYSPPQLYNLKGYKLPLIVACAFFTYFQARTVIWYPKVPYLYVYGFIFISTIMLRTSILRSLVYATFLSGLTWSTLIEAGQCPRPCFQMLKFQRNWSRNTTASREKLVT